MLSLSEPIRANTTPHSLEIAGVVFLERLENAYLDLASIAIFLDRADDLDSDFGACLYVFRLDDFPECALTQKPDDAVCRQSSINPKHGPLTSLPNEVFRFDDVVPLCIVPWRACSRRGSCLLLDLLR